MSDIMLCGGEGYSWEQDNSWPTNADIIEAFSSSENLTVHCVINSAGRELFVVASSCRNAKIIAIFHGHLQGLGCGICSDKELQKYAQGGAADFHEKAEAAIQSREPQTLWSAGYWADELRRRSKERSEQLLLGVRR